MPKKKINSKKPRLSGVYRIGKPKLRPPSIDGLHRLKPPIPKKVVPPPPPKPQHIKVKLLVRKPINFVKPFSRPISKAPKIMKVTVKKTKKKVVKGKPVVVNLLVKKPLTFVSPVKKRFRLPLPKILSIGLPKFLKRKPKQVVKPKMLRPLKPKKSKPKISIPGPKISKPRISIPKISKPKIPLPRMERFKPKITVKEVQHPKKKEPKIPKIVPFRMISTIKDEEKGNYVKIRGQVTFIREFSDGDYGYHLEDEGGSIIALSPKKIKDGKYTIVGLVSILGGIRYLRIKRINK